MRKIFSLVILLVTCAGHASVLDAVVGFPESRSLLNASCQGLLGYASGTEGAAATSILREHRVRTLNRANAEAGVAPTFTAHQDSNARALDRLAGHIRGVERWTATGQGEVHGFVLRGGDAISLHFRRLADLREMIADGRRADEAVDHGLGLARLIINGATVAVTGAALLAPPWGPVVLLPALAVIDPISANRALLSPDLPARAFDRDVRAAAARPDADRWLFASRTYVVRDGVLDAIRTRDPRQVVDAMREQNWAELNMLLGRVTEWSRRRNEGPGAAHALRAQQRRSYVIVDQFLRFTPEPELVVTVRMTKATPRTVFARDPRADSGHLLGTATQR